MVIRDAQAIKLGSTDVNKIYYGTGKVYDMNKTALEGYCIQNGEPTPDNPIEIQTMKERQVINVKGTSYTVDLKSKNLLKVTAVSQTKNNIVFTVNEDKTILANGKANSTTNLPLGEVYLEANQTYILNGCPSNGGSGKYRLELKNSGGTTLANDNGNGISYTPTESGNYSIVLVYWYNYTLVDLLFKPMIRLSSIIDDTYEPYYNYELAGIKSKNLYNKDYTKTNNSYILQDGTIYEHNNWRISDYIPVTQGQNYTYQGLTAVGTNPYSAYYDKDKVFISSFKQATGTNTITIPNGVAYVRFSVNKSGGGDLGTFQVEKGSTASSYEFYYDYTDTIFTREGKWYVHKETEKVVLDGSESWAKSFITSAVNTRRFRIVKEPKHQVDMGYCNKFIVKTPDISIYSDTEMVQIASGAENKFIGILINLNRLQDEEVASFTTWLSSNNITIYYALLTPTEEEITAPILISQLNTLYNAM